MPIANTDYKKLISYAGVKYVNTIYIMELIPIYTIHYPGRNNSGLNPKYSDWVNMTS